MPTIPWTDYPYVRLHSSVTLIGQTQLRWKAAARQPSAQSLGIAPTEQISSLEEARLLQVISEPLPHAERFSQLTAQWENDGLDDDQRAELLQIVDEREAQNSARAEAIMRLSELRGISFGSLWRQMMGEIPTPRVPRN